MNVLLRSQYFRPENSDVVLAVSAQATIVSSLWIQKRNLFVIYVLQTHRALHLYSMHSQRIWKFFCGRASYRQERRKFSKSITIVRHDSGKLNDSQYIVKKLAELQKLSIYEHLEYGIDVKRRKYQTSDYPDSIFTLLPQPILLEILNYILDKKMLRLTCKYFRSLLESQTKFVAVAHVRRKMDPIFLQLLNQVCLVSNIEHLKLLFQGENYAWITSPSFHQWLPQLKKITFEGQFQSEFADDEWFLDSDVYRSSLKIEEAVFFDCGSGIMTNLLILAVCQSPFLTSLTIVGKTKLSEWQHAFPSTLIKLVLGYQDHTSIQLIQFTGLQSKRIRSLVFFPSHLKAWRSSSSTSACS
jgi:hypothetical protein